MAKKTFKAAVKPPDKQLSTTDPKAIGPTDRAALIDAIETERQRIFRARALAQTAAKLLHELYIPDRDEPDIGYVLDVVSGMLEDSLGGLDSVTLNNL